MPAECPRPDLYWLYAAKRGASDDQVAQGVLTYHTTGASNGPTEAVSLLIKKVQRAAQGFRNFDNYHLRLLLVCGSVKWQTQLTARILVDRYPSITRERRVSTLPGSLRRASKGPGIPQPWRLARMSLIRR